jgi:nicotinic acid mononucleotide adenylyltransferase
MTTTRDAESQSAISLAINSLLSRLAQETDFGSEALHDRVAKFVNEQKTLQNCQLAVCIAGGGGHFVSALAATPGASSVLLEGVVAYSKASYRDYVEASVNGEPSVSKTPNIDWDNFKFCSQQAALIASEKALQRALICTTESTSFATVTQANSVDSAQSSSHTNKHAIGVACASALTTVVEKSTQHHLTKAGRAHICVTLPGYQQLYLDVRLSNAQVARSRLEQDYFVSCMILEAIEWALQIRDEMTDKASAKADTNGDCVLDFATAIQKEYGRLTVETVLGDSVSVEIIDMARPMHLVVEDAARSILDGSVACIALKPTPCTTSYTTTSNVVLPHSSVILPGSFNPPHVGHVSLAEASIRQVKDFEAGSSNQQPSSDSTSMPSVWFELALTNADKPSLQPSQVIERLGYFLRLQDTLAALPASWGILLTNTPLFAQKIELLYPLVQHSAQGNHMSSSPSLSTTVLADATNSTEEDESSRILYFVIGSDTLVRIINPKYYNNSQDQMLGFLYGLPPQVRFVVGGRLEGGKVGDQAAFVSGQEAVQSLPSDLHDKFLLLPDFRVDTSSTEIRAKMGLS